MKKNMVVTIDITIKRGYTVVVNKIITTNK